VLTVRSLDLEVPQRRLLTNVEFDCPPGSSMAIVGPSGSGKSTLLNTLAGIVTPKVGEVAFDGCDFGSLTGSQMSRYRLSGIGMVFQFPELFPELTALENAALVARLRGTGRGEAETAAATWLGRLGVGHLSGAKPGTLSGGEAQRVGIARAFVPGPRLVLADEPTGSLDEGEASTVARLLIETAKSTQAVLVLVTHNPIVAHMSDLIFEIVQGSLVRRSTARAKEDSGPHTRGLSETLPA
jgi:putative ABC transport system ATP-binding protein